MKTAFKCLLVFPLLLMVLSSCTDYGKKVKAEGTKGEVFYKGDGVTESDAKKLAAYLTEIKYFDNSDKSVQLVKAKDGGYDVRFVIDEKKLKEKEGVEDAFVAIGAMISKEVFGNQPVNVCLADTKMKDIKILPFNRNKAETLLADDETNTGSEKTKSKTGGLAGYDSQVEGGITFYWKDPITDEEAETIGKAVENTGAFAGGNASDVNIIMEKEGNRYLVKFPVAAAYRNDASYLVTMETVAKQIKDAAFPNVPYSFIMTDEMLNLVKSFDY